MRRKMRSVGSGCFGRLVTACGTTSSSILQLSIGKMMDCSRLVAVASICYTEPVHITRCYQYEGRSSW